MNAYMVAPSGINILNQFIKFMKRGRLRNY